MIPASGLSMYLNRRAVTVTGIIQLTTRNPRKGLRQREFLVEEEGEQQAERELEHKAA